jgi:hypothetical protein
MPLVFAENEESESGITYQDRTGISYQFPKMYRRIIQPGERFVYYRGRRKRGGGRALQVYFGVGLVGNIAPDPNHPGRLICDVLDYQSFPAALAFKDINGRYFERGAERRGYFQRGVRAISEDDLRRILEAARTIETAQKAVAREADTSPEGLLNRITYASPEIARAVEDFAVRVALEELSRGHRECEVERQPHNNPGFDILVTTIGRSQERFYVEVKGTQRGSPQFFATEGELQFSRRYADKFRLVVVYGIELDTGAYKVFWHTGPIASDTGFRLKPVQWICEVVQVSDGQN